MLIEVDTYNLVQAQLQPLHREALDIMQFMRELKTLEKEEDNKLFHFSRHNKKRLEELGASAQSKLRDFLSRVDAVDASLLDPSHETLSKLPTSTLVMVSELRAMWTSFKGYQDFFILRDAAPRQLSLYYFTNTTAKNVLDNNYKIIMQEHEKSMQYFLEAEYFYTDDIVRNRQVAFYKYINMENIRTTLVHDLLHMSFEQKDQLRMLEKAMRETREVLEETYQMLERAYKNQRLSKAPKLEVIASKG